MKYEKKDKRNSCSHSQADPDSTPDSKRSDSVSKLVGPKVADHVMLAVPTMLMLVICRGSPTLLRGRFPQTAGAYELSHSG